jgi:peptidoglycan/xylan/chitin deacetylase (PgdA/CDA1 family)
MSRSLIANPPPWPNGARCAVCFSYDMDAESLLHLYQRDAAPSRIATSSALRYGPQVAIPRIVEMWKRFDIRQTVFIPGWCVETYPDATRCLVDAGHEVGHHGWLHEKPNTLSREDEARVLDRAITAFEKVAGRRPMGYRAPAYALSAHTADLLIERGFSYDASLLGDDIPYLIGNDRGTLVELPSDFALDDWVQYVNMKEFGYMMPIQAPQRAIEVFRAEFDAAWKHGGMWIAVWHPFVSGRLARADAVLELIEYMVGKGDVWFAPMSEIAAHIRKLVDSGTWRPRLDRLPFWETPVEHLVTPIRG